VGKFKIIRGTRDSRFVEGEDEIKALVKAGASFRVDPKVVLALTKINLSLTNLRNLLLRFRIDLVESQEEEARTTYAGCSVDLEYIDDDEVMVIELRLRVAIEKEGNAKRIAVLDVGGKWRKRS